MARSISRIARQFATGLFIAALASTAVAAPQTRIFKAKMTVSETITFTGQPPCFGIASLQGVGQSSPLGSFTVTAQDCVNPQGAFDPSHPLALSFASLASPGLVFTAANGDRVFATYSGTVVPQSKGLHRISGFFVVTGGTGLYAGATGGGLLFGQEDLSQVVSAHGEIEALGTINY